VQVIISAATSRAFFGAEKLIFPKEHQNPDVNIKYKQLLLFNDFSPKICLL
jgi:hypothetical protein